jgi:hypothetical protein
VNSSIPINNKPFKIIDNDFPTLSATEITTTHNNDISFINSLKKEILVEKIELEEKPPNGWVSFKHIKHNFSLLGNTNSKSIFQPFIVTSSEPAKIKTELNESTEIINSLSKLHKTRTQNYINLWGEDEYNTMFICQNHDYEYFDKLDEAYEIAQSKMIEKYAINDYTNYNDYNDYNDSN